MKPTKKTDFHRLDKTAKIFEVSITVLFFLVIAIKVVEIVFGLAGVELVIIETDFDSFLSAAFALVIGVEFTKMLFKHTPETVIDVLLFAIARQTVIYHERTLDLLIGAIAVAGMFAAKKFLIHKLNWKEKEAPQK
jgi:hypothetical protein